MHAEVQYYLFIYFSRKAQWIIMVKTSFVNTLRTGSFKLFKRPFPGFLTILTL